MGYRDVDSYIVFDHHIHHFDQETFHSEVADESISDRIDTDHCRDLRMDVESLCTGIE